MQERRQIGRPAVRLPDFWVDADVADELEPADPDGSANSGKQRVDLKPRRNQELDPRFARKKNQQTNKTNGVGVRVRKEMKETSGLIHLLTVEAMEVRSPAKEEEEAAVIAARYGGRFVENGESLSSLLFIYHHLLFYLFILSFGCF